VSAAASFARSSCFLSIVCFAASSV
jgi:hypothetical protein